MSKMGRKNKRRKPPKPQNARRNTENIEQNTQQPNSSTGFAVPNAESYYHHRRLGTPHIQKLIFRMKENNVPVEPLVVQVINPNILPTEPQPSTSNPHFAEANKDETSSENEVQTEPPRTVRRRCVGKSKATQETNSGSSKMDENSDEIPTEMPENSKASKRKRRRARGRPRNKQPEARANVGKQPEARANVGKQRQATNDPENASTSSGNENTKENTKEKAKENAKENDSSQYKTFSICKVPLGQFVKSMVAAKDKEKNTRKPDTNSDPLEKCPKVELDTNETMEVTIDCTEYVPMFADNVPIRHYEQNNRSVRIVQRPLLDSDIPPLTPVELFPNVLSSGKMFVEKKIEVIPAPIKKEPVKPKQKTKKGVDFWHQWDPFYCKTITQDVKTDENVAVANENTEENTVNPEEICIKSEIEEDAVKNKTPETSPEICQKISEKIVSVESNFKKIDCNMAELKVAMEKQLKMLSVCRLTEKEQMSIKAPGTSATPVAPKTETINENQKAQPEQPSRNQEKVIFSDKNTVMEMSSACSKSDNVTNPLCGEAIKVEPFAACSKDVPKPRARKLKKQSDLLKMSFPDTDTDPIDTLMRSKITDIQVHFKKDKDIPKPDFKPKSLLKKYSDKDAHQQTSTKKKVHFDFDVDESSLVASNRNEEEVGACVREILQQLRIRQNSNCDAPVITEQPRPQARKLKTVEELNSILVTRRATATTPPTPEEENVKLDNDSGKIDYRLVIAKQKKDIEEKLKTHEFCTCARVQLNPEAPHLCIKGHRLCFWKNSYVSNEEVALSAAEWSYLLKLGYNQEEIFYKEMLAKNTVEDSVNFLRHVENELIANGITVSSIPALRIESDREFEVDENDPETLRAEIIRKYTNRE